MDKCSNFSSNENQVQKNIKAIRKTISGVMKRISLLQNEQLRGENTFVVYTNIENMMVRKKRNVKLQRQVYIQ